MTPALLLSNWLADNSEPILRVVAAALALGVAVLGYLQIKGGSKGSVTPTADGSALPSGDVSDAVQPQDQPTLERVLSSRVLRIGCIEAAPWFVFDTETHSPRGIYPAIFADIAERNSLQVVYRPLRNDQVFDWLDRSEVDVVAQLLLTERRSRMALFAAFIHHVKMVAVVRRDQERIRRPADLRESNGKCAVVEGEIGAEVASDFYAIKGDDRRVVLKTRDVWQIFRQIHGDVEVAITTGARWVEFQEKDPAAAALLTPLDEPLLKIAAGSLVRRDEIEFKLWIERETAITRAKPDIRELEDRYLTKFDVAVERI